MNPLHMMQIRRNRVATGITRLVALGLVVCQLQAPSVFAADCLADLKVGGTSVRRLDLAIERERYFEITDFLKQTDGSMTSDVPVLFGLSYVGHAYLVVGDLRFDGNIWPHPGSVKRRRVGDAGLVLKFKDLPTEHVARLRSMMEANVGRPIFTLDCISSTCKILEDATGLVPGKGRRVLSSQVVKRILEDGFRTPEGMPAQIDAYWVGPFSPSTLTGEVSKMQTDALGNGAVLIAMGATGVMMVGVMGWLAAKTLLESKPAPTGR